MILRSLENGISVDLNLVKSSKKPKHLRILQAGGFVHQMESGIFAFSFLGSRVIKKIIDLFLSNFVSIGGLECIFPSVQNRKIWENTKNGEFLENRMGRVGDDYVIAPSNEVVALDMLGNKLNYKNIPRLIFGVGHCFRNEIRPKNGLLRCKEFLLFDGYAICPERDSFDYYFNSIKNVITEVSKKIELNFIVNNFGKIVDNYYYSQEFVAVDIESSEKRILFCQNCKERFRFADFKSCPFCNGEMKTQKGLEYSDIVLERVDNPGKRMIYFQDNKGLLKQPQIISFGIGITKILGILVEQLSADNNFVWPSCIQPIDLVLIPDRHSRDYFPEQFNCCANSNQKTILIDNRDLSIGRRIKEMKYLGVSDLYIVKDRKITEHIKR